MNVVCRLLAVAAVVLGVHAAASAQHTSVQAGFATSTPGAPVVANVRTTKPTDLAIDVIPVSVADVLAIERSGNFVDVDRLRARPLDGNEWHVGDVVDVDLTVTADEDAQFVAIEDPLPAGLEYQPRQHESGDDWSGLQFFDDRVVFFATRLSRNAPLRLHYRLRATTAGTFSAPPPTAYAMYGPPSMAAGRTARITIR